MICFLLPSPRLFVLEQHLQQESFRCRHPERLCHWTENIMYQIEICNVFCMSYCSIRFFLLFLSISYLANFFWYLTHSSSNVIWLKLKCSILLLIISVLGVLGSVPECSDTILCMMSFNFAGRKELRNWKVKIYFAIRYYSQQLTNGQIQKGNMKRHCLTKFLNSELTLGFKKTYMIGFQKQFLWNETKSLY